MPFPINVPYNEKDRAKSLGAFWNADLKLWTIPDHVKDINPFNAWVAFKEGYIIRKPYVLCLSKTNCWKCGKETPMIALGARNYFFIDYAVVNDPKNQEQLWFKGKTPTLFRYLTAIDDKVLAYLSRHYPFFRQKYSNTIEGSYFANTCTFCGSLQGDFHNHEDFGGAFLLDPFEPKPSHIKLISLDIPYDYQIDAQHGEMAYEPIFFPNKMQTAGYQRDSIKVIII